MATRPLDRLTSIRAKLGSTVVIAVALALAISYVLIAFALRNSPRDSEAIDALSLARTGGDGQAGLGAARDDGGDPPSGRVHRGPWDGPR